MRKGEKLAHRVQAAKGVIRSRFGRATGNTRLQLRGHLDRISGKTKQAGDRLKGALKL